MNPRVVLEEILHTALKVSLEKERILAIFERSGIHVDGQMHIVNIAGEPLAAIKSLMNNLSELAVVKISAKQIIRKAGLTI